MPPIGGEEKKGGKEENTQARQGTTTHGGQGEGPQGGLIAFPIRSRNEVRDGLSLPFEGSPFEASSEGICPRFPFRNWRCFFAKGGTFLPSPLTFHFCIYNNTWAERRGVELTTPQIYIYIERGGGYSLPFTFLPDREKFNRG